MKYVSREVFQVIACDERKPHAHNAGNGAHKGTHGCLGLTSFDLSAYFKAYQEKDFVPNRMILHHAQQIVGQIEREGDEKNNFRSFDFVGS